MLQIEANKLKAAMECVATGKDEPRFYLKGVLLEVTSCGDVHLVSTDGGRLFFGCIPGGDVKWSNARMDGVRQVILPYDSLKRALTVKNPLTLIEHRAEDNRYSVNGIVCTPINGQFPMWRKVVDTAFRDIKAEAAPMDWGTVATVEKALRMWSGNRTATVRVHGRGESVGALVTGDDANAFAIVMPQKVKEQTPFLIPNIPAPLEEQ